MVGPGRKTQSPDRGAKQGFGRGIGRADFVHRSGIEARIAHALALDLGSRRCLDPIAHRGARFHGRRSANEVILRHSRDLDLDIDAIEQRPGNAIAIAGNLIGSALAAIGRMAEIAARARVHCRHQLEPCRKFDLSRRARHADAP